MPDAGPILSADEKRLIYLLSGDLGDSLRPYAALAQELGWSEEAVLAAVRRFYDLGLVRRFGVTLWHQKSGFVANALTVWQVAAPDLNRVGEIMAGLPYVSHCYQRTPAPGWPFNLYGMIHAQSRNRLEEMFAEMAALVPAADRRLLESLTELKKTSLRYFAESAMETPC